MFSKKEVAQLKSILSNSGARPAPAPPAPKKKTRKRRKNNPGAVPSASSSGVQSRIKYTETVCSVTVAKDSDEVVYWLPFSPIHKIGNSAAFPILSKFCKIYETYKIMGLTIHWASSCSAMTSGLTVMAVDSNPGSSVKTISALEKFRPVLKFPVRQASRSLPVPQVMISPAILRHANATSTSTPDVPVAICLGVKAEKKLSEETNFGLLSITWDLLFVGISPTD